MQTKLLSAVPPLFAGYLVKTALPAPRRRQRGGTACVSERVNRQGGVPPQIRNSSEPNGLWHSRFSKQQVRIRGRISVEGGV